MKLFARPKCFADAMALLMVVTRLLGLRAFEFRGRPMYTISFIYLSLLFTLYFFSLDLQQTYYSGFKLLKLESVIYKLETYLIAVSVLIKLLFGWWCTEKFKICHKNISAIDQTLRQLGLRVSYDRIYFVILGITAIAIAMFCFAFILVFIVLQEHMSLLTAVYLISVYSYAVWVNAVVSFEFYIIIKCIRLKFEAINRHLCESLGVVLPTKDANLSSFKMDDYECILTYVRHVGNVLRRHRKNSKSQIVSVSEKHDSMRLRVQSDLPSRRRSQEEARNQREEDCSVKIKRRKYLLQIIKQVHLELCKVSKTLCTIFGVQIASEIGISILFLTGFFFNLYVRYFVQQPKIMSHLTEQTLANLLLAILCISKFMFLSRVCKTTADEANRTVEIIYTKCGCDTDADLKDEIQQFGIQILQSPVVYTAFGLPLDNVILTTALRTITTYLVIMIQVSNSLESDKTITHSRF